MWFGPILYTDGIPRAVWVRLCNDGIPCAVETKLHNPYRRLSRQRLFKHFSSLSQFLAGGYFWYHVTSTAFGLGANKSNERRARSEEPRAVSKERRAKSEERGAKSKEQRAKSEEQRD